MRSRVNALPLGALLLCWVSACPASNSKPCSSDSDCTNGRCRLGACGPYCLSDSDCGTQQVCQGGACVPAPECAHDADCAQGFHCSQGQCLCVNDSACASNQTCEQGKCQARTPCKSDQDCLALGKRCEVVQGICIAPCALPTDCAPGIDPNVATALYQCFQGDCLRRCLNDATCGTGFICEAGVCATAQCQTFSDCPTGQYCTSGTFGRCVAYQTCSTTADCAPNFTCQAFDPTQCPPGFACQTPICQELPKCLIDSDCAAANGPPGPGTPVAYCGDGHCQTSVGCTLDSDCPAAEACIGAVCVPEGCRGASDCTAPQACVGGSCVSPPAGSNIGRLQLSPAAAVLEVGDTAQLDLIAYTLGGASFPLAQGTFTVVDSSGQPSGVASVDAQGQVTALDAGTAYVRASLAGSIAQPAQATLTVYPAPAAGKRVLVIDAATRVPISGAHVVGCDAPPATGPCPAPVELTTDATGQVTFSFTGATADFSAAGIAVRADGLPEYNRVSVVGTASSDLLIPLTHNPVHGAAGFNGVISFENVHSTGTYWAGFTVLSFDDPTDEDLRLLLGDPFFVDLPGVNQAVPVPGSVVLYTSIGFGIPDNEIKGRSLGLGQPGRRHAVAFAGRADQSQITSVRSADFLAYTGYMDYGVQPFNTIAARPYVADTNDINNNGLCSDPQKCPQGSEDVPDYGNFAPLSMAPQSLQTQRTEVDVPNVDPSFDTVIVSAVAVSEETGVLPLGFASQAAAAPDASGTRPVPPIVLQSGPPTGGVEAGDQGVWAIATGLNGQATFSSNGNLSARLTHGTSVPTHVILAPFLPQPEGSTYAPPTRTFSPGQPQWNDASGAGASLAKLELTGSEMQHVVYFAVNGPQTAVRVPTSSAAAPGADPAGESSPGLAVDVMSLGGRTADQALDLPGDNLTELPLILDGYSRFVR